MSGSLLNRVLDACQLVTNRLSPNDYIVIWGFNNIATKAHCGLVGKLDFKRLRKDMQKSCGGLTALFDAIGDAHQGMVDNRRGKPPCHPFLIVFTDGGDNSSTKTSADVKSILQRTPVTKLRTIFITAGLSPGDAASVSNALPQGGVMFQAGTDDGTIQHLHKCTLLHALHLSFCCLTEGCPEIPQHCSHCCSHSVTVNTAAFTWLDPQCCIHLAACTLLHSHCTVACHLGCPLYICPHCLPVLQTMFSCAVLSVLGQLACKIHTSSTAACTRPDSLMMHYAESIKREFKRAGNLMHVGALEVTWTDTANNTTSRVTITTQAPTQGGVANNMNALAAQMGSSFAGLGLGAALGLPPSQGRLALPAPRPRSSSRW